ncbi:unnamed protein product [Boreogadus saida]
MSLCTLLRRTQLFGEHSYHQSHVGDGRTNTSQSHQRHCFPHIERLVGLYGPEGARGGLHTDTGRPNGITTRRQRPVCVPPRRHDSPMTTRRGRLRPPHAAQPYDNTPRSDGASRRLMVPFGGSLAPMPKSPVHRVVSPPLRTVLPGVPGRVPPPGDPRVEQQHGRFGPVC